MKSLNAVFSFGFVLPFALTGSGPVAGPASFPPAAAQASLSKQNPRFDVLLNWAETYKTLFPVHSAAWWKMDLPYHLQASVTTPGNYAGWAPDGAFTLTASTVIPADYSLLPAVGVQAAAEGLQFASVFGSLSSAAAPEGISVYGIAASHPSTGQSKFLLIRSELAASGPLMLKASNSDCSEDPLAYPFPGFVFDTDICGPPCGSKRAQQILNPKKLDAACAFGKWDDAVAAMVAACQEYHAGVKAADEAYAKAIAQLSAGYVGVLGSLGLVSIAASIFTGGVSLIIPAIVASGAYAAGLAAATAIHDATIADLKEAASQKTQAAIDDFFDSLPECCVPCAGSTGIFKDSIPK